MHMKKISICLVKQQYSFFSIRCLQSQYIRGICGQVACFIRYIFLEEKERSVTPSLPNPHLISLFEKKILVWDLFLLLGWMEHSSCLSSYLIPSLYQRNRPSICLPVWSQSRSCNPPFCTRGCPVPTFPCSQCPCFWSATSASQTGLSEHRLFHPLAQLYNFSRLPHYWCYARAGCVGETELATEEAWGLPAVLAIPTHFEWFVWMAWWMFSSNRSLML